MDTKSPICSVHNSSCFDTWQCRKTICNSCEWILSNHQYPDQLVRLHRCWNVRYRDSECKIFSLPCRDAYAVHELFCEVVIAPDYEIEALKLLKKKKNRILLIQKETSLSPKTIRTCLNGYIVQDKDSKTDQKKDLELVSRNPNGKVKSMASHFLVANDRHLSHLPNFIGSPLRD